MSTIDSARVAVVRDTIALARANLTPDPGLAVFIVRDLPETDAAGLGDLAWSCHRDGCSRNDVIHILDELEKYLVSLVARDALTLARQRLAQGAYMLALFTVRDLPETDAAVGDLAWSCCRHGCTEEQVADVLNRLEEHLDG